MKTYFTSDLHLGHENIIKYCNRPFKSLDEMNTTIINRWNQRVKADDFVYHIGDFCFRNSSDRANGVRVSAQDWINRLNGHIIFIKGNHDRNNSLKCRCVSAVYEHGDYRADLVHNPERIDIRMNLHLVGHVHNHWKRKEEGGHTIINVGVDVWDFYPRTFDELIVR